jgi:predicted nucleic acid-binding protein
MRKQALSIAEINEFLFGIRECCRTHARTPEMHDRGLDIAERYGFRNSTR